MTLPTGEGDAFPRSGLNALLDAAVKSAPASPLFMDDGESADAAELSDRVRRLAQALRVAGLRPGERVLVVAAPQVATLVAIIACLRAGLEPALARPGLKAVDLAAAAIAARAGALIGPSRISDLDLGETYLSAAALAESIRLVATQGPDAIDGALDLSADSLVAEGIEPAEGDEPLESPMIATFDGPPGRPVLVSHRQATLFADALSLVEQARINPSKRIVSTIAPCTLAGLVAGPFAAMVGASSLALHGPFSSRAFLAACDAEPGCHVVLPGAVAETFCDPLLVQSLSSLILVSRFGDPAGFALPPTLTCERPLVDLYAFSEESVLAQRRHEGEARPPSRIGDAGLTDGLGARLNRARAEYRANGGRA